MRLLFQTTIRAFRRQCLPLDMLLVRRTYSSTAARVPLAYDLHEPANRQQSETEPPIIFMHGLFGSKKNNRSISKVLARDLGRRVFAIDLRNHGESPHDPRHDYLSMANDVAGFAEEECGGLATVIGHSMGAKTAMTLALQSPHLVHSIVSVDNAPLDAALLSKFGKYVQGMKQIQHANIAKKIDADHILAEYEEAKPIRDFLLGNLQRDSQGHQKFSFPLDILGAALDSMGDFPFRDPSAVRFEKPALFVRGTQSKYVPDEATPVIGQFFPRFLMADIDAGHWLISEKPEDFRQTVIDFLAPPET